MPPASGRLFDSTFIGDDWYNHSMARILDTYARENKNTLPTGLHLVLYDAGVKTFCHESRIHMWIKNTDGHDPVHPDQNFVQNGYTDSFAPLIKILKSTTEPQASDPHITKVRNDLLHILEVKLACLDIDTAVRRDYYKNY